jgi:hypothetical protein
VQVIAPRRAAVLTEAGLAARLEQPPTPPERTLSDSIEHHVICLVVLREVLHVAVDNPFGAQAAHKLEMRGVADRGHTHPTARRQLDDRGADCPGRAVDEHTLPSPNPRLPHHGEGVMGSFGGRGGLRVGQIRWYSGQRGVSSDVKYCAWAPKAVSSYPRVRTPPVRRTRLAILESARRQTGGETSLVRRGTIFDVTSRPATEQHLRDLALLRRVRDRIDREYTLPLDVEALARGAHISAGHLSRQFKLAYGESPYS